MTSTLQELSLASPPSALVAVFCTGIGVSLGLSAAVRLPVIAAYVAGTSTSKRHGILLAVLFTAGMIAGTVLLGISATPAQDGVHQVLYLSRYLFWAVGISLFVVGVSISGLVNPDLLPEKYRRFAERLRRAGTPGAFLLGAAFGLLQMPISARSGTELLALVQALDGQGASLQGGLLLLAFAAGQGIVILATGILTSLIEPDIAMRFRKWMCSIEQRIQLLAGNVLMILGIYFVIVG